MKEAQNMPDINKMKEEREKGKKKFIEDLSAMEDSAHVTSSEAFEKKSRRLDVTKQKMAKNSTKIREVRDFRT